jgi:hypothetical protein
MYSHLTSLSLIWSFAAMERFRHSAGSYTRLSMLRGGIAIIDKGLLLGWSCSQHVWWQWCEF